MRLIDADKLYPDRMTTKGGVAISQSQIANAPTVEPERKTGKWVEGKKTTGYIKWNCSECGLLVRNPQKPWYEYCPKCGADMREVQDDD